jgi:glycosyltransferase involved in cell wall biosynthesis
MRFLYCVDRLSGMSSDGDTPEIDLIRGLIGDGHQVDEVLPLGQGGDVGAGVGVPGIIGEPNHANEDSAVDAAFRNFVSTVSKRIDANNYDAVLACGFALNRALMNEPNVADKLWSLLPSVEVDPLLDSGKKAAMEITELVQNNCFTLVESAAHRTAVQRVVPAAHQKVVNLFPSESSGGQSRCSPLTSLANMAAAKTRVLIYRDSKAKNLKDWASATYRAACSIASVDVHVVVMCHDAAAVFNSAETSGAAHVTVVEPAVARHQISDGQLQPRFAAYHVAVAAEQLDCAVVLTDDLETVRFGRPNQGLRPKLWPVIEFGGLEDFSGREKALEQLSAWVSRLVIGDEKSRAILESRIPSATSKTIMLSGLWFSSMEESRGDEKEAELRIKLQLYLDRFVPDYSLVPRRTTPLKVVMAGHDFKFAGELLDVLAMRDDVELRADYWKSQNVQDEELSRALLDWADVIFCEFASHNAVWYSWEKRKGQTLIVRLHGYELWSPWIQDINLANVDKIVFVSEFYRDKVVDELGWPREKTAVIPNVVDVLDLYRPKREDARFHIGIVGIVPILKRPDRALDLLERLLESDERYTLHVRGRSPWEYGWMWQNGNVRDAYEAFYERLASDPRLRRRVSFQGFGPDMGRWFQNIGWMLSPSSRETFHLAPVEGMASGAVPVVWEREGARQIFGEEWVHEDTRAAAEYIITANEDRNVVSALSQAANVAAWRFDMRENGREWVRLVLVTEGEHSDLPSENVLVDRLERNFESAPTTTNLSRLVSALLRDGNWARVHELIFEYPELAVDLPARVQWRVGVQALKDDPLLIPRRSSGAAYLVRRDTVLYTVDVKRMGEPESSVADACHAEIGNDALRLVAVMSAQNDTADTDSQAVTRGSTTFNGSPAVRLPLRNVNGLRVDKFVMAAADALVREARAFRPAAIAAQSGLWTALPALVAARRLGIPLLMEKCPERTEVDDLGLGVLICREADGDFAADASPLASLYQGIRTYEAAVDRSAQRSLSKLKVGVIADEFTSRTIAHSFETVPLSRSEGYLQVSSLDLDAIFVESAWEGPQDEWRRGVAYHPERIDDLRRIIAVANARSIPVLFWNKEDPVHFRAFERTAGMIDHVFTTDADMVGLYLQNAASRARTVSSMPFYAEPEIHNALPADRPYSHTVSYAGTYYGDRFRERSIELHRILDAAKVHGLTIYDRQVNVANSPYSFPSELADFVREGVPYDEVLKVYKSHPVHINVNSANDSPTMFSRRVVEIAASGSVVLSGKGRGITEQLQGIEATDSYARWAELLQTWLTDERERLDEAWRQMRTVTRSHLAEHALTIMMRTAGLSVRSPGLPSYALWAEALSLTDVSEILAQTWRPNTILVQSASDECISSLASAGVQVRTGVARHESHSGLASDWFGSYSSGLAVTHYEDLLHATRFGDWSAIGIEYLNDLVERGEALVRLGPVTTKVGTLYRLEELTDDHPIDKVDRFFGDLPGLTWRV